MKGPIVSIDVSKGKSDYQAFKDLNVKYTGSRSIKHNKEGFDEIVNLVREMEKKLETEVCFKILKEICDKSNGKYKYIEAIDKGDAYYGGYVCIEIEGERFPYTPRIWHAKTLAEPKNSFSYFMQEPVVILNINKFIRDAFVFLMCQEVIAYSIES